MRKILSFLFAALAGCNGAAMMGDGGGTTMTCEQLGNCPPSPDLKMNPANPDLLTVPGPDLSKPNECIPPQEHAPTGMPVESFGDMAVLQKKWYAGGDEVQMFVKQDNECTTWVGLSWISAGVDASKMLVISKYRLGFNCGPKRDASKPCYVAIFATDYQSFMTVQYTNGYPSGQACDATGPSDNPSMCAPDKSLGSGSKPH